MIIKECKRGAIEIYRAIPPIKKWPGIIYRATINFAKGVKDFVVDLAKFIRDIPKALYDGAKYILKRMWEGIKAIPRLIKFAAQATWSGIKAAAFWVKDLFLK